MRYYISDLHFFHASMNDRMDFRGFHDVEEMNEYMIRQWNSRVRHGDEVVVLGDFSVARGKETNEILRRLKGKKYLVVGNHDKFLNDKDFDPSLFKWIKPYAELNDNKRLVCLSHYPIMCYNGQYRLDGDYNPKAFMLYGHLHMTWDETCVRDYINKIHNKLKPLGPRGAVKLLSMPCEMINCFCMYSDYVPLTLDELIEVRKTQILTGF